VFFFFFFWFFLKKPWGFWFFPLFGGMGRKTPF